MALTCDLPDLDARMANPFKETASRGRLAPEDATAPHRICSVLVMPNPGEGRR